MGAIIAFLVANKLAIVELVLAVLGVASIVARLTPNESDNKVVNAIPKVVNALGLTKSS